MHILTRCTLIALTARAVNSNIIVPKANAENTDCAYLRCVRPTEVASSDRPSVSQFCESILKSTPVPKTTTTTTGTIVVITPPVATVTQTTTVTGAPSTTKPKREAEPGPPTPSTSPILRTTKGTSKHPVTSTIHHLRQRSIPIPSPLVKSCKTTAPPTASFSKPCSCFLTTPTVTETVTTTQTGTLRTSTTTVTKTVTVYQSTA